MEQEPDPSSTPPRARRRLVADAKELSVIQRSYDLALWAIPLVERFPRSQRSLLGDRIQSTLHDLLEGLLEAKYTPSPRRLQLLDRANLQLTRLRFQLRLAADLGHLRERSWLHACTLVDGIGREVGGWRRSAAGRGS